MKEIAIIIPNNIWYCPFMSAYKTILDDLNIQYDIISWNRDGSKEEGIQYNCILERTSQFHIYREYQKFIQFVKKTILQNKYSKLIVFTSQPGIFLSSFLKKHFKGRYIFDYRDLSIEQKIMFKFQFRRLIDNSFANVISSPGFLKHLPNNVQYVQTHNIVKSNIEKALEDKIELSAKGSQEVINILTIGGIRDYESNIQIIESLANNPKFKLSFVGKGIAAEQLKEYVQEHKIANVFFEGYYPKEKEKDYIDKADFINIFYPRTNLHDSAISNRFYNSLAYKKPMIVTADTTQGNYASKYNVGLAIESCKDLDSKISEYISSIDSETYNRNCDKLLIEFLGEYREFENVVQKFARL